MKTLIMAAVLVAGVAFAQEPIPVEAEYVDGGLLIKTDLFAGKNAEGKREQSWGAAVIEGVKNNYGKILGGVAAGALTVYLIEENQDDKKKTKASKEPAVKPDPTTGSAQTATAGGNSEQNSQTAGRDIINNYYPPVKVRVAK